MTRKYLAQQLLDGYLLERRRSRSGQCICNIRCCCRSRSTEQCCFHRQQLSGSRSAPPTRWLPYCLALLHVQVDREMSWTSTGPFHRHSSGTVASRYSPIQPFVQLCHLQEKHLRCNVLKLRKQLAQPSHRANITPCNFKDLHRLHRNRLKEYLTLKCTVFPQSFHSASIARIWELQRS